MNRGLNLRRFLSTTSLYALGDLVTKGARFVLVPYYVQVLTKTEIGTLGVLQAISIAAWTLFAFSSGFAVPKYYFDGDRGGDRFVAAMWWLRMALMLGPCCLLMAIGYGFAPHFMPSIPRELIALALLSGFLRAGFNVVESWFMIRSQPMRYRSFTFIQFVTTTLLIIYLVSFRNLGVMGVVLGETISYAAWTIVSGYLLREAGSPGFRNGHWPVIFRYCASLLPHTMFMWALACLDRVILQQYVSMQEIGVYELAYTLASCLSVAALAMRAAWLPSFFRDGEHKNGGRQYAHTASYFFAVVFFVAAGLIVFAPEAVWIITGGKGYQEAVPIMRVAVAGLVGHAMFMAVNQPLLYDGKNARLSIASFATMLLNIGLNVWLIPSWGTLGAAFATCGSYAMLAAIAFVWTRKFYRIPWQREVIFAGGSAAATAAVVGCILPAAAIPLTILMKSTILLALLAGLGLLLWRQRSTALVSETELQDRVLSNNESVPLLACPAGITRSENTRLDKPTVTPNPSKL